ncbi:SLATT domain-containing protein [Micromonospora chalcea]|uniref:SLATT domain-containing protein n=1 Tax=Micromonospora chalcea TaxID=1874 RepID=UPI000CE2F161|nr:SLATT domain-containing protein [Micromonospora chalcea]PPA56623.1 hypothetical protein BAW75_26985 [Micromonospora chalcea]
MTDRDLQFSGLYRKHRLHDQRIWYRDRQAEYELAHDQAMRLRNALFLFAASAAALAQLASDTVRGYIGISAAALSGLAAVVTAYDQLIGFPTLQKTYRDTARNLETMDDAWDTSAESVGERVELVEQMLLAENAQWGKLSVQGATGVAALLPPQTEGTRP